MNNTEQQEFDPEVIGDITDLVLDTEEKPDPQEADDFRELKKSRDPAIRDRLVRDNLSIVVPVARKFTQNRDNQEDLIQVGYIGLIKAVDNYDPDRGVKFITYATHCVMGEIRHYIRDKAESVKRPRWLTSLNREVTKFMDDFLQNEKRLPSIKEISTALNIESEGIVEILKSRYVVSLDDYGEASNDYLMLDRIKSIRPENFRLPVEDRIVLEQAIEQLKLLEKSVINLFFYKDLTQSQIAVNLGLSQKKVSRMLKKAIEKLRETIIAPKGREI
ncbi:MAG: sigma-70 family RNA polymerase sigma factor [Firmicutes bacterium]|nr:sigma-70 family RNA polymerase sigma factor [Bacillota bacterium]